MVNKIKEFINKIDTTPKGHIVVQFVKFGVVGVSNTLISLATTYLTMFILHLCLNRTDTLTLNIGTTVGFVVGVINSYFWNSKYVFKDKKEKSAKKSFLKVVVCYGVTYLISMVLMDLLVKYLSVPEIIAPIPRWLITIPLNFIANKLWAFKDKK